MKKSRSELSCRALDICRKVKAEASAASASPSKPKDFGTIVRCCDTYKRGSILHPTWDEVSSLDNIRRFADSTELDSDPGFSPS